jgi:hypothetical protein
LQYIYISSLFLHFPYAIDGKCCFWRGILAHLQMDKFGAAFWRGGLAHLEKLR